MSPAEQRALAIALVRAPVEMNVEPVFNLLREHVTLNGHPVDLEALRAQPREYRDKWLKDCIVASLGQFDWVDWLAKRPEGDA